MIPIWHPWKLSNLQDPHPPCPSASQIFPLAWPWTSNFKRTNQSIKTNQSKETIIQGWLLYLIRSFLNFDFRFQYQLSILCIFLLTSFHLAEVSLFAFSWLYTLECAVVQKHHEMYFIHIFSTHFAIKICFICTILKCKQYMEQQPHRTVYKKTDEFYIEWQRLATTNNEWCNECQRMTTSGTTNVNER